MYDLLLEGHFYWGICLVYASLMKGRQLGNVMVRGTVQVNVVQPDVLGETVQLLGMLHVSCKGGDGSM